jgi:hypothetical protein
VTFIGRVEFALEYVRGLGARLLRLATDDDRLSQGDRNGEQCPGCGECVGDATPIDVWVLLVKLDRLQQRHDDKAGRDYRGYCGDPTSVGRPLVADPPHGRTLTLGMWESCDAGPARVRRVSSSWSQGTWSSTLSVCITGIVAIAVLSQGSGGIHRRAGPNVSHPVLVMRRFGIVITPLPATAVDRPVPLMGWGSVNGVTTPRKRRAGELPRPTTTVCTQRNSSRRRVRGIARRRRRCRGHRWSRSARSKSESASPSPTCTRPRPIRQTHSPPARSGVASRQ